MIKPILSVLLLMMGATLLHGQKWPMKVEMPGYVSYSRISENYDGGYLLTTWHCDIGACAQSSIIKLTPNGDTVWSKLTGTFYDPALLFGLQTMQNGEVVATGYIHSDASGRNGPAVMHISPDWEMTFAEGIDLKTTNFGEPFFGDDGSVILHALNSSIDQYTTDKIFMLIRFNSDGKLHWIRHQAIFVREMVETEAEWLYVGTDRNRDIDNPDVDLEILRLHWGGIDTQGNLKYVESYRPYGRLISQGGGACIVNGEQWVLGERWQYYLKDNGKYHSALVPVLVKLDGKTFKPRFERVFGDTMGVAYMDRLMQVGENRFLAAGVRGYGKSSRDWDTSCGYYMMIIDSMANVISQRIIRTDFVINRIEQLTRTSNGHFLVVASGAKTFFDNLFSYIVKIDSNLQDAKIDTVTRQYDYLATKKIDNSPLTIKNEFLHPFSHDTVLNGGTWIRKEPDAAPLRVSPNPSKTGAFTVTLPAGSARLQVFDARGREIKLPNTKMAGDGPVQLDLGGEANGIYYLRVEGRSQVRTAKLVKTE